MNLGYTGKPYDSATGLYDYGYRDYASATARFTTVDPIRDGSNWFAYVNNDPVNWVDPWGLSASEKSGNWPQIGQEQLSAVEKANQLGTRRHVALPQGLQDELEENGWNTASTLAEKREFNDALKYQIEKGSDIQGKETSTEYPSKPQEKKSLTELYWDYGTSGSTPDKPPAVNDSIATGYEWIVTPLTPSGQYDHSRSPLHYLDANNDTYIDAMRFE
jgi:RHS repeat-associated protein